ncbi:hypothetical protein AMATHDRAFT_46776 [Amanita thiersii Skay4041]|uniref:Uncharacterized protein n=1 Tax=Amanita thiersii Skay4041 TaxID=703135 RepID=A0A2A9NU10_9AGAR|nr:hypothetical protein AMATHDRAFT_46776 [Amanita thiersii Skay4041]
MLSPLTIRGDTASSALVGRPLFVPGLDPQPIAAAVLGVDSNGRTTYQLENGAYTDTWAFEQDVAFVGTMTLVEGPDYASLNYVDPDGQFVVRPECTLDGRVARCSMSVATGVRTATQTFVPFPVLVVTTTTPAPSATSSPPMRATELPSPTSAGQNSSLSSKVAGFTVSMFASGFIVLNLLL